jgi:SP family general alpha glucoside:H+ symporter-like MFS transporter
MLNPGAWDWGNYAGESSSSLSIQPDKHLQTDADTNLALPGFFWGAICFCCIIYTYFRVPEPSGRSFAELDLMFEKRISARKFAKAEVNVFDDHVESRPSESYGNRGWRNILRRR